MSSVSSRHEDDLGGQLARWWERRPQIVQVLLGDTAGQPAVQHTAWMLSNLLTRMDGIVAAVHVAGPTTVPLADRVVPAVAQIEPETKAPTTLVDALIAGAATIDVVPISEGVCAGADVVLEIGPGPVSAGAIRVHGDSWAGGISAGRPLPCMRWSALPFGPYTAACLAAARVFLLARAPHVAAEEDLDEPLIWTTWSLCGGGPELFDDGPVSFAATFDAGLAGVGAVGSAAMHVMWATPDLTGMVLAVDGDRRGVDETNLNRGVLFVRESVDNEKAPEAAGRLSGGQLTFEPHQGRYEERAHRPDLLLSAVDTNAARDVLQGLYPARVIGASTHGLRAELLRTGPAGVGACLRCFNEPEAADSDEALRARVRDAGPEELASVAARAGVSVEDARRWVAEGGCGGVEGAMLGALRESNGAGAGEFAVAFVSAFAGTLLAAEAMKEATGAPAPLGDSMNRVTFQFLRPRAAKGPHFAARDAGCPACRPGPARDIWARRCAAWGPARG